MRTMRVTIQQGDSEKVREKIEEYEALGWTLVSIKHEYPLEDAVIVFSHNIDDVKLKPYTEAKMS